MYNMIDQTRDSRYYMNTDRRNQEIWSKETDSDVKQKETRTGTINDDRRLRRRRREARERQWAYQKEETKALKKKIVVVGGETIEIAEISKKKR